MHEPPLRVLVADGHPSVRRALRAAIAGVAVCFDAVTALDALAKTVELAPDVVLLDAALPGFENLEFTEQLARIAEGVKILVLGVYESDELAKRFRDAGAHGYMVKADAGLVLADAIRAIVRGGTFFSAYMLPPALERAESPSASPPPARRRVVTPREREVLRLLADGKSNKEVAVALNISVNTVETHRAKIMSKLELHSIGDLVRYAIRNRLIDA
ncbi:MAG TPA: response regulator transcription factor [Vicinamibacterales bacterium]|nr:response regulator transcription factor [Vicinamibacterales bacterium]